MSTDAHQGQRLGSLAVYHKLQRKKGIEGLEAALQCWGMGPRDSQTKLGGSGMG